VDSVGLFRNILFAVIIGAFSGVTRAHSCDNPELIKRIEALEREHYLD